MEGNEGECGGLEANRRKKCGRSGSSHLWPVRRKPALTPDFHKGLGGDEDSLRQRMEDGGKAGTTNLEARLSFKDLIFALFLNRSEQRKGWDLEGAVWSGGVKDKRCISRYQFNKHEHREERTTTDKVPMTPRPRHSLYSQIHRGGQVTFTALRKEMT